MDYSDKVAVLHVALNPVTGPWSVIRSLAMGQRNSGFYAGVAVGVIAFHDWPHVYLEDLSTFSPFAYRSSTPKIFGTASFLLQRIIKPPLARWILDLSKKTGAKKVVIHFHNAWLSGVFLPIKVDSVEVISVTTFHGVAGAHKLLQQPIRRLIHRWIAQRLILYGSILTSVDRDNLAKAELLFHLSQQCFHIIPNGLPGGPPASRVRNSRPGALTIAHVGILNRGKGWWIAAEAVLLLKKRGIDIKLILAGNGPDEENAQHLARNNPDCIEYLGYVRDPVKTVFPKTDLFVLMTDNDGLPMAIIEALSCAVPVISTRIGGIPAAVKDFQSGRLVDRDVLSLAHVLYEFHENPYELDRLSKGALALFRKNFELGKIVRKYDATYKYRGITSTGTRDF